MLYSSSASHHYHYFQIMYTASGQCQFGSAAALRDPDKDKRLYKMNEWMNKYFFNKGSYM